MHLLFRNHSLDMLIPIVSLCHSSAFVSSAMILFTSSAATSIYSIFGLMLPDFAVFGFVLGFFSSLLGQTIMKWARQAQSASGRRFERNSYIAFVIGGVVLTSALLMTIQYVFSIVEKPDEDIGGVCVGLRF
jgi:H+/Cl- antiporter ClcA